VTGSAIYRHFQGKDEILAAIFDRALDLMTIGVHDPLDDPRAELAELIRTYVTFALDHSRLAGIWEREPRALAGPFKKRYQRRLRAYLTRWTNCLERCYPGTTPAEIRAATRAVQVLLLSESTRSGSGSRLTNIDRLLSDMAIRAFEALDGSA
jgi:AcrR family transcriptional regulator